MPKKEIKKETIDKKIFTSILKEKNMSIIKLGACEEIGCTERTIRRALHDGKITPCFLEQIAKHLDVHPHLLSGKLHRKAESYPDDIKELYLTSLNTQRYPYYRKQQEDFSKQPIERLLTHIFSLFEISYSQFEELSFEEQYQMQYDLFNSIIPVIRKHFKYDAYGRKDMPNLVRVLADLQNYHDDYFLYLYADEILRSNYSKNPPTGMGKQKIHSMSPNELLDLDFGLRYNQ